MTEIPIRSKMIELIYNHHQFQECVLTEIKWRNWGLGLDLVFNYIWPDCDGFFIDERGHKRVKLVTPRSDLDTPLFKTLSCQLVQEFSVHNYLNDQVINHPDEVDWGFSEIALVDIPDDNAFLSKYRHHRIAFHHVRVLWEGDRRIDIVCKDLAIE